MLLDRNYFFSNMTEKEKKEAELRKKESLKTIDDAKEGARNCLKTGLFIKYLQSYQKAYDAFLDIFVSIQDDDPHKRLSQYDRLQAEVLSIRSLLKGIVQDSREELNKAV